MPHETAGPTGNGNARPDSPLPETQGGETPTEYHKKRKALKAIVTGKTCRRRIRIGQSHENRTVRQARKSRTQRRFYSSGRLGGRKSEQDGRKLRREPCRFAGVAICRSQRMSPLSSVRRKYELKRKALPRTGSAFCVSGIRTRICEAGDVRFVSGKRASETDRVGVGFCPVEI